jgi:hypothetical protein
MELEESGTQVKGKSLKSICIWDDLLKEACSGKRITVVTTQMLDILNDRIVSSFESYTSDSSVYIPM